MKNLQDSDNIRLDEVNRLIKFNNINYELIGMKLICFNFYKCRVGQTS